MYGSGMWSSYELVYFQGMSQMHSSPSLLHPSCDSHQLISCL